MFHEKESAVNEIVRMIRKVLIKKGVNPDNVSLLFDNFIYLHIFLGYCGSF